MSKLFRVTGLGLLEFRVEGFGPRVGPKPIIQRFKARVSVHWFGGGCRVS